MLQLFYEEIRTGTIIGKKVDTLPTEEKVCMVCLKEEDESNTLLCDGQHENGYWCNNVCHVTCAGFTKIPTGDWFCYRCDFGVSYLITWDNHKTNSWEESSLLSIDRKTKRVSALEGIKNKRPHMRKTRQYKRKKEKRLEEKCSKKKRKKKRRYNKSNSTVKTKQNMCIIDHMRKLNKKPGSMKALVLDTEELNTTKMLLQYGLKAQNIYIPNDTKSICDAIRNINKKLNVFEKKMGSILHSLATSKHRFDLIYADYCGMVGESGKPNFPMDDFTMIKKYNILQDEAVVAVTVCGRSYQKRSKGKYEQFKLLKNYILHERVDYDITNEKDQIYTEQGHQTMCHFSGRLNKI